jgi:hypothetical protein
MKVEEVSDAEEEQGPVPITFLEINMEPEVRCMSLYVHGKVDLETCKSVSCLCDLLLNVCEHDTTIYVVDWTSESFVV